MMHPVFLRTDVDLLLKHTVNTHCPPDRGSTALHYFFHIQQKTHTLEKMLENASKNAARDASPAQELRPYKSYITLKLFLSGISTFDNASVPRTQKIIEYLKMRFIKERTYF